ncbi:hypothetical protein UFOVP972_166 [uncultured Caudovirales phage]|uniref:Uncharacterized protein n=1 Tax=uncultured Caudovirales phage TaxID=2100421 RepID=A0A6J5PTX9_9CAUD|nr:hypothetical protein UFOVP972_166 [uncultured Caudovirales phage]
MSFINWGHETPEQKEIRRRMEERMMFEQMSYSAAMAAAAAAGAGGAKKNYVLSGRSSMTSYYDENGDYQYYTYNYDTDTLNKVYSPGFNEAEYNDQIYVLQDKGFMLKYNRQGNTVYIFTDINGQVIRKISMNDEDYNNWGVYSDDGVSIIVYLIIENTVTIHLFDGETVKKYTIDDIFISPWGADFYTLSVDKGVTFITWQNSNQTAYYLGLMSGGEIVVVDSIVAGESTWDINASWDSDFITVMKANYTTSVHQSFRVIGSTGNTLLSTDIASYGHTSLQDENFYGKGKYFFILKGGPDIDMWAYDRASNTIIQETIVDGGGLDCTAVYHYQDAGYPNGLSNWDDDGILGVNISNTLLIIAYNVVGYYFDGYTTDWFRVDECYAYTLFDGDDQFYSYDMVGAGLTAIKLDDYESLIRSFGEDQSIVLDAFTWDEGAGVNQSTENLQRLSIRAAAGTAPNYLAVAGLLKVGENRFYDKFFLGSRVVYVYYDSVESQLQWTVVDSDGMSNPTSFTLTNSNSTEYYRTHDTLVVIDNDAEKTYVCNQYSNHTFLDLNTETGVWYNKAFISDKNGNGDTSPTTEYAFYQDNTGWGSIVLVHDTGLEDADYGKTISILQDDYFEFTLPMIFTQDWTGELGRNTLLFAWENGIGGWSANLYDLQGTLLSGTNITADAAVTGQVDLWNLNDRAIISVNPNTNIDDHLHYYFGQSTSTVSVVNVGQSDYWWENDFPAWYFD